MSKLQCPNCKEILIITNYTRYKTLIDRQCKPDDPARVRPAYTCPQGCYGRRIFWDEYGETYIAPGIIEKILWKFAFYDLYDIDVPDAIRIE